MALLRGKRSDMPPDAILLTEQEAVKYQTKIISSWKNKSDTFAFNYGGVILTAATTFAGVYMNNYYRTKFRLLSHGRVSSYLPIVVIPSVLTLLLHSEFVIPSVILQKCAICSEMRSSVIQGFTGCILPSVLAPLSAIPLAIQYNTYDVPYITREPMKVFRLWQKQTKPVANIFMGILLGQALLASAVTYFEAKSVHTVNQQLAQLEFELEHHQ